MGRKFQGLLNDLIALTLGEEALGELEVEAIPLLQDVSNKELIEKEKTIGMKYNGPVMVREDPAASNRLVPAAQRT